MISPRAAHAVLGLGGAPLSIMLRHGPAAPVARHEGSDVALLRSKGVLLLEGRPYTGLLLTHDSAGRLREEAGYRDGLRDGEALAWYANGQLAYRRQYAHDRETGTHTGWWEDGSLHFTYQFVAGALEGTAREWFRNGKLYREFNYRHGQEEGAEKMWYPDGIQRANYVMRDGRRFGLPGTKGCTGEDSTQVTR